MKKTLILFASFGIITSGSSSAISCFPKGREKPIHNDRQNNDRQDNDRLNNGRQDNDGQNNYTIANHTAEKLNRIASVEIELVAVDLNVEKLRSAIKKLQKYTDAFKENDRVELKEEIILENSSGTAITSIANNDIISVRGVVQEVENNDKHKPFTFTVKVKEITLEQKKVNDALVIFQKLNHFSMNLTNRELKVGILRDKILNLNVYKDAFEEGVTLKGELTLERSLTNVALNNPDASVTNGEYVVVKGAVQFGSVEKSFTFTIKVQEVYRW